MNFWKNKRVFITGHTGFKGSWLCLWLSLLGAKVYGYALNPPTKPSLYNICKIDELVERSIIADVRDLDKLKQSIKQAKPEIVFHLAAQPIVRESYKFPVETFDINIMGTVHLLEAVRQCPSVKSVVVVTTDKIYKNPVTNTKAFKEEDALGGYDPYSSSKAGAELVSNAYYCSYFKDKLALATARAGNVIGGGDFASDRLVPDFVRAIISRKPIIVRNPNAVRPWQHVLDPLNGYMLLAQKQFSGAWNFGPNKKDIKTVGKLVETLCDKWSVAVGRTPHLSAYLPVYPPLAGRQVGNRISALHEAHYLELNSKKAKTELGWDPKWDLERSLEKIVEWIKAYIEKQNMRKVCIEQIEEYLND